MNYMECRGASSDIKNTMEETKTVIHLIYVTSPFIITGKSEERAIKSKMCWWFLHKRLKASPKPEVHFTTGFRALKCKGCWRHEGVCGRRGVTARIINLGYQRKPAEKALVTHWRGVHVALGAGQDAAEKRRPTYVCWDSNSDSIVSRLSLVPVVTGYGGAWLDVIGYRNVSTS
jgi:hypothetical protein